MKILHLTADFKWTGPAEPMLQAVVGLRARGHELHVAFPAPPAGLDGQLAEHAHVRGIEPVHELARRRGFRPWRDRDEIRRLRNLFERERYDLVHVHHTRDHLLARFASWNRTPPLVVSWHQGDPIPAYPWNRALFGTYGAEGLCVLSSRIADDAEKRLGWPPDRVAVVPGPVDTERFSRGRSDPALRERLGLRAADLVIAVVARLQPHRRFDLLLDAFARAQQRVPALRLLVLGRGTRAREVLTDPVREMGIQDFVIHPGYQTQDYVDCLALARALVFLVPGSDGSCRALLEAMSLGIPGIVSARGLLPELVRHGVSGRIVAEDAKRLAETFESLAHEPESWREMGRAARASMCERHTLSATAEALECFYARLLAR